MKKIIYFPVIILIVLGIILILSIYNQIETYKGIATSLEELNSIKTR